MQNKKMIWIDSNARNGSNYYRIKFQKFNGAVTYSNIINLRRSEQSSALQVYPNPMKNTTFTMKVKNLAKGSYHITLLDAGGQLVHTEKISHVGGFFKENITLSQSVTKGCYTLKLSCEGKNSINAQILHL